MRRSRISEEKIICILKLHQSGLGAMDHSCKTLIHDSLIARSYGPRRADRFLVI